MFPDPYGMECGVGDAAGHRRDQDDRSVVSILATDRQHLNHWSCRLIRGLSGAAVATDLFIDIADQADLKLLGQEL
jgi:hypothetical protein